MLSNSSKFSTTLFILTSHTQFWRGVAPKTRT